MPFVRVTIDHRNYDRFLATASTAPMTTFLKWLYWYLLEQRVLKHYYSANC